MLPTRRGNMAHPLRFLGMKTTKLFALIGTALVGLTQPILALPRGSGGSRGSFAGGHVAGGLSPGHIGGFAGGGARAAPAFSRGGARFSSGSVRAPTRAPQQFYYYSGARSSGFTQHAFVRQLPNRSSVGTRGTRSAIVSGQQDRAGSPAKQNTRAASSNRSGSMARQNTRVANQQTASAAVRHAIANKQVFAHHSANWHRDWDKHRVHFHNNLVFVFVNGFWWGLPLSYFPWDYYPYYGYYPYGYYGYPYDYYDYSPYSYEDDQGSYAASDQYANGATVNAVQSELAKLGYYRSAVDGVLGDETEAALARYQQDHDISVTGTLTLATLDALGLQ